MRQGMAMADVGRTLLSASAGTEPYSRPLKGMAPALPQNSLLALVIPKDFSPEESAFSRVLLEVGVFQLLIR